MNVAAGNWAERELARRLLRVATARLAEGTDVRPAEELFGRPPLLDGEELHFGDGLLRALERLAVLSPSEASRWQERFEVVRSGAVPAPTEELRVAAEAHLGALAATARVTDGRIARAEAAGRLEGALNLFVAVGCVGRGEGEAWRAQLAGLTGESEDDAAWDEAEPPVGFHALHGPLPEPDVLRAVLAVPLARHDGMCVKSVALHARSTQIRWHLLRDAPPTFVEVAEIAAGFTLDDDAGTAYGALEGSGSWGGVGAGPHPIEGSSACDTPVPPEATELTITRGDASWRVPLPA